MPTSYNRAMDSRQATEIALPRLPDAAAQVYLARQRLAEVRDFVNELDARLERKVTAWLRDVSEAHAAEQLDVSHLLQGFDKLERSSEVDRDTATRLWSIVHNFKDPHAVARMQLLEALDRMSEHREHTLQVLAVMRARLVHESQLSDDDTLSAPDRAVLAKYSAQPLSKEEAKRAKDAPEGIRDTVQQMPLQRMAGALRHPKADHDYLAKWCGMEAKKMFGLEFPTLGTKLSGADWTTAIHVWGRKPGGRPRSVRTEGKWEYLASFVGKAELGLIDSENLRKARRHWCQRARG